MESPTHEVDSETDEPVHNAKIEHKPVWHDDDDDDINVGTALNSQGRKLPDGGVNSRSNKYTELVKRKYESLVGTPKWAKLDELNADNSDDEILQTTGHISHVKAPTLEKGILRFKRVKNLNIATGNEGPIIRTVQFHPKSTVALVAGESGIASLVTVDGYTNDKLHSVAFKKYPVYCARFNPDGSEAYIGSVSNFFYMYDLMNAKALRVPLPQGINTMKRFEISKCGKFLAICGKYGQVHLLCARTKEFIRTFKLEGKIKAITFSCDSKLLYGHSSEGSVTVWDISTLKVTHKWIDDGCTVGSCLCISPCGTYFAAGSREGIVNVYETKDVLASKEPKPLKILSNLTTEITSMAFNPTSEMLVFASSYKKEAIRIAHLPSFQVYSNFPGLQPNTGNSTSIHFSPNSGYLGFGSNKKLAYLYRINHYKNY